MWCKVLMFQPIYHVSVSPTDGNGPTQGQRKTLTRVGFEPTTFEFDHRCSTEMKMLMARQWICRYKERLRCISNAWPCRTYIKNFPWPAPVWPCSSVGGAAVIKLEGRGFKSHPGQSFPLSFETCCMTPTSCSTRSLQVAQTHSRHPPHSRSPHYHSPHTTLLTLTLSKSWKMTCQSPDDCFAWSMKLRVANKWPNNLTLALQFTIALVQLLSTF